MFLDLKAHDLQTWTGTSRQSPPNAVYWTGSSGGITQRCPSQTAACSLPASTPWTPCLTLPPSGRMRLPHFTYRNGNMKEELCGGLPCCGLPWFTLGSFCNSRIQPVQPKMVSWGMDSGHFAQFEKRHFWDKLNFYPQDCWTIEQSHWRG